MAKTLHFLQDEGTIDFKGKQVLELGSGVGLLGIYLGCLGANVVLTDLPVLKSLSPNNINLNREMLKGKAEWVVLNWKKNQKNE